MKILTNPTKRIPDIILILLPLCTVATVLYFAVNVPVGDDYDSVLGLLIKLENEAGFFQRLSLLFSGRNEHTAVIFHVISWLDYCLFGEVNFRRLLIYGQLFYLGIVWLLYRIFQTTDRGKWYFLPIVLLLSVPHAAVYAWTSAALVYLPMVFFSLLTLYCLEQRTGKGFKLALLALVCAVLGTGGGLVVVLGFIPYFFTTFSKKEKIISALVAILIMSYYLFGFSVNPGRASHDFSLFNSIFTYGINGIVYFGAFFEPFFFEHYFWKGMAIIGLSVLVYSAIVFLSHRWKDSPLLTGGLLWALGLGAALTLMRSHFGPGVTVSDRYGVFHILPVIFLYLILIKFHRNPRLPFSWVTALCVIVFIFGWRIHLDKLKTQADRNESGLHCYLLTGNPRCLPVVGPQHRARNLDRSLDLGIFAVPSSEIKPVVTTSLKESTQDLPMQLIVDVEESTEQYYLIRGWAFLKYTPSNQNKIYAELTGGEGPYYVETGPYYHSSSLVDNHDAGFSLVLEKKGTPLAPGTYDINFVLYHPVKGIVGRQETGSQVEIGTQSVH